MCLRHFLLDGELDGVDHYVGAPQRFYLLVSIPCAILLPSHAELSHMDSSCHWEHWQA